MEEKNIEKEQHHDPIEDLVKELEKIGSLEEKIAHLFQWMQTALSHHPSPQFGLFWKGRLLCLSLFKEPLPQTVRSHLWAQYSQLMQEAKGLKEISDEASSFAVEQIDLAITALEESCRDEGALLEKTPRIDFPSFSAKEMAQSRVFYEEIQRELTLFHTFAARIHSLRKEIIQTGMRLKFKNRFFARLSQCGDLIFPKRRELMKRLSERFVQEVKEFVQLYCRDEKNRISSYLLREEIKAFQELAKTLSLNTRAFVETRIELSRVWDELKEQDREKKKERDQREDVRGQNAASIREKVKLFSEKCASLDAKNNEMEKEAEALLSSMREVELSRRDVLLLKEEIKTARQPLFERERRIQEGVKEQKRDREEKARERVERFTQELKGLCLNGSSLPQEELQREHKRLKAEAFALDLFEADRLRAEALLDSLEEILFRKREEETMVQKNEPDFLDRLYALYDEREEARKKSKDKLEEYRKAVGGSGFDFEKALLYNELLEEEKKRLENIEEALEKIESRITKLEE